MPAKSKPDLLAITEKEYSKLVALLNRVPPTDRLRPDPQAQDTTIKDIVGHRAHWIDLFLGWYKRGQTGASVAFPAPGYKWNDLKRYNADLRAEQSDLDWDAAIQLLATNHQRLMHFLNSLDEDALFAAPMKGGRNAWTTGRWAEAAGASHYRSAAKYIRQQLRHGHDR